MARFSPRPAPVQTTYSDQQATPQVALHLTRLLESTHAVTSVIRDSHQSADIDLAGGKPFVLSVEEDPVEKFAELFEGYDVVVWLAGAGGKATEDRSSEERTEAVDYKGAVKVCAIPRFEHCRLSIDRLLGLRCLGLDGRQEAVLHPLVRHRHTRREQDPRALCT
jgi:hypothetical protein